MTGGIVLFRRIGLGILIVLLATSALAAVPWSKFSYFQNYGGLNDNLSSTEIADNEATDIQNIIFDTGGALKKRYGYTTLPSESPRIVATGAVVVPTGLAFYKKDDSTRYLVVVANSDGKATVMKKDYAAGGGPVSGVWNNIDSSLLSVAYNNNYLPSFAVAQNVLVFTDGVPTDYPMRWLGTTEKSLKLTNDVDLPTASIIVYHKNILFASGNNTYPSRVFFSNLDDIYTWDALDFFDLETSDGSKITGMISALDALYIFKEKSIWRLSGTNKDDYVLQKMVDGIGTASNSSIKVVNGTIYFVTPQNDIAVYDGAFNCKFISQKIRSTIGNLSPSRAYTSKGLAFSSYKYNDYDYYASVSIAGSGTNNQVLVFDTAYNAWTKFKGINANCWVVGDDANSKNVVYFGDYSGYVHVYPSTKYYDGNVATSAIASLYQTKWFRYPEVSLGDKYWRLLKVYCISEDTDIYLDAVCRSDFEAAGKTTQTSLLSSQAKWDVGVWDVSLWGGQTIMIGRHEIEKGQNMFQIKFENDNVNEGFTIIGFETFIEGSDRI
jgi:hypothetical protein